jgi:hypothetical protein
VRLIELLFCSRTDFVQFRVQASDFGVQFDKVQALRSHQPVRLHAGIILGAAGFQKNTSGWHLRSRVVFQVDKIETRSFHDLAIMPDMLFAVPKNFQRVEAGT